MKQKIEPAVCVADCIADIRQAQAVIADSLKARRYVEGDYTACDIRQDRETGITATVLYASPLGDYEVARWDIAARHRQAWHSHPHAKLCSVISGDLTIEFAGCRRRELRQGDVFHIDAGERHCTVSVSGCSMLVMLIIGHPAHGRSQEGARCG
jgi:quercetin dioxygenase-like cupin family protein